MNATRESKILAYVVNDLVNDWNVTDPAVVDRIASNLRDEFEAALAAKSARDEAERNAA